ncbi:cytochrome P450 [Mycena belliarum]|uniref:Cytochrome P450 n=1 Tax=Mycena belliarum TaxID=1033014 RepID=A0AAD6U539_9AGAR|nr:cytochrome P450 [Mycena belliae]
MFPLAISSSIWVALSAGVFLYAVHWKRDRSRLPLPPGPKKLPLVQNLFDMPADRHWETYSNWSKECDSDIIHVGVPGMSIVVLSSMEAVRDLFDKRSSTYSDRPRFPMLVELMKFTWAIGMMKYGENWRAHRKFFHEAFNIGAAKQFQPQERAAAHEVLRRLLRDPDNVLDHFRHMAGSLIMLVTYGIDVDATENRYVQLAEEAMYGISVASLPGRFLVDTIPALKYVPSWVPGAQFKRMAQHWRESADELVETPFAQTKQDIKSGTAVSSFVALSLAATAESSTINRKAAETTIKTTAASMYAAGADTTVSALGTFVLGMLANPEVQQKAQAELDSVIGAGNLPDFKDQEMLPYVSAIAKEVLRWQNVTPIAIPHYVPVEDEYRGYRIPAGSVVIGNVWAILHDEEMYPDPQTFNPERFLLNGKLNPDVRDPATVAFGFGRRICPGKHLATSSLWITIASMLATLDIKKARDENGKDVVPTYEYLPGIVCTPLPFKYSITPRSRQAVETIQATSSD